MLSTARDLFYEVGFHGTTVRDIAGRVGVTVPALYYHHSNKEAILAALLDRSIRSVIERCEQALDEAGDDPADRFRNLIECLALYMANHGKSAAMDVFKVTSPPDTGRALLGMIQAITVWFSPGRGRLTASELASRYVDIATHTVGMRS
jgi:AcrR family transcriptional regulator